MLENVPKQHILLITISTILSGFSLGCILFFTQPESSGITTYTFLYFSIFLLAFGISCLIGIYIRQLFKEHLYIVNLSHSFRQAILFALLITGSLILQAQGLLYWWVEASLVLFLASIEAFLNLKI